MTKPTQDKETLREAVARIIAAELGDDFDAAFVDKAAWISARGYSGGRFRDVNEPFQRDYLDAADAAIATMFERLRTPSEGMIEAGESVFDAAAYADLVGPTEVWQAMLTAFQQENSDAANN